MKNTKFILPALLLVAALVPLLTGSQLRLATELMTYVVLALSWNLIGGFTGYASFGNVVFFGIGAYTAAMFATKGLPFVTGVLVGTLFAGIFAFLIGLPVLRLKGHYFSIATLGVAEAVRSLIPNIDAVGGPNGLTVNTTFPDKGWYIVTLVIAIGAVILVTYVRRGKIGFALRSIRDDETGAQSIGINVTYYKVLAFTLSAVLAGVVGGVYSGFLAFIDAPTVFQGEVTVTMLVMALLGGTDSIFGPVIGAIVLKIIMEYLWTNFQNLHGLFLGVVIILIVLFIPKGILPSISALWRYLKKNAGLSKRGVRHA